MAQSSAEKSRNGDGAYRLSENYSDDEYVGDKIEFFDGNDKKN